MKTLQQSTIRLHADDSVVTAASELTAGASVDVDGRELVLRSTVPVGHKLAAHDLAAGEPVRKYGQIIGFASAPIAAGEHVHTHNLEMREFERDYAFGSERRRVPLLPERERATFQGVVRPDGRVATRNYIGILTSVNCSATAAKFIAQSFALPGALDAYPNVDGVVALTHGTGCGMASAGEGFEILQRTLAGYAAHPNMAALLVLGLGCEVNQVSSLMERMSGDGSKIVHAMTIQDTGGTTATVREGVKRVQQLLPQVNDMTRTTVPAAHLVVGLECGGSDAASGMTANPALGAAADLVVRHGGTAVLGETPEIFGAEHLLTRRAVSREVGEKVVERIRWWEEYTARNGATMDNNPSPGNKEGGLTTILEKSLGAVVKAGTTDLVDVYRYAEPITAKGMTFMDTPGYDPVSVTGMVAGGANVVCFTTGRGSVFGCKPTPSLKLATNTAMYRRMAEDMDINCGTILDGDADVDEVGRQIFQLILETASGRKTRSEELGLGDEEFAPWQLGAVM